LLFVATRVSAGPTPYGWLIETDTVPAGGFEIESSIYEHVDRGAVHERRAALLLQPKVALTETIMLALPLELASWTADDAAPASGITRYGAELRWRFLPHAVWLRPLARFALARDVTIQTKVRSELGVAASCELGRLQLELDTGLALDVNFGHMHWELRPGAGVSVRVTEELRLGAEVHAELSGDSTAPSWAVLGPNIAWSRGQFWVAGVAGIGIHNITAAPRLNVGMVW
jgi:hypothetical protein